MLAMSRAGSSVYNTEKWKTLSVKIRRKHPYCFICSKKDVKLYVDHIIELSDGGQPYELSNLQVLCASCHTTKTNMARGRRDILSGGAGWSQTNNISSPPHIKACNAPETSAKPKNDRQMLAVLLINKMKEKS